MIELDERAKKIIRDGEKYLKDGDYDKFFNSIDTWSKEKYNPIIYQFIMFEAGIDLLSKMSFIPIRAFTNCYHTFDLVVPSNIKKIEVCAFFDCKGICSIDLCKTDITEIPYSCFTDCSNLHKVILPDTVKKIEDSAFNLCRHLKSINLDKVDWIEDYAFAYCTSLRKKDVGLNSTDSYTANAFFKCGKFLD